MGTGTRRGQTVVLRGVMMNKKNNPQAKETLITIDVFGYPHKKDDNDGDAYVNRFLHVLLNPEDGSIWFAPEEVNSLLERCSGEKKTNEIGLMSEFDLIKKVLKDDDPGFNEIGKWLVEVVLNSIRSSQWRRIQALEKELEAQRTRKILVSLEKNGACRAEFVDPATTCGSVEAITEMLERNGYSLSRAANPANPANPEEPVT